MTNEGRREISIICRDLLCRSQTYKLTLSTLTRVFYFIFISPPHLFALSVTPSLVIFKYLGPKDLPDDVTLIVKNWVGGCHKLKFD